jgi:hypothetical protein
MTESAVTAPDPIDPVTPAAASPGRRRRITPRRVIAGILVAILVAGVGATAYFAIPNPDLPEAAAALASSDTVAYATVDGRLEFEPATGAASTGLILYPGGKVDAAAYAPAARDIAASGYLVVIVPMPLNLAVLGIDAAGAVIAAHPEVATWAIGGHSLGGAMAAEYAARHPGTIAGLVFWAAYSAADLSGQDFPTLLVFGSLDAGATRYVSPESVAKLPSSPITTIIDGGNHEQMGWYTGQPNDPPATIARAEQQRLVVAATVAFLSGIEAP